jgi:hypothetical protein
MRKIKLFTGVLLFAALAALCPRAAAKEPEFSVYTVASPVGGIMTANPEETIKKHGSALPQKEMESLRAGKGAVLDRGTYHILKFPGSGEMTVSWTGCADGNGQILLSHWDGSRFDAQSILNAREPKTYTVRARSAPGDSCVYIMANCSRGRIFTDLSRCGAAVSAGGSGDAGRPSPSPAAAEQKQNTAAPVFQQRAAARGKTPETDSPSAKPSGKWPEMSGELSGAMEVRVRNPNNFEVKVGLRSGGRGKDFTVSANGVKSARVPNGRYDVYFQYSTEPDSLYQGDSFTLSNNGVEIQIVKVAHGNFGIRKVK